MREKPTNIKVPPRLLGPHYASFSYVLGPHPRGPVAHGQEVFREERITLQAVNRAVVSRI